MMRPDPLPLALALAAALACVSPASVAAGNPPRAAEYGRVKCVVNNPCRAAAGYRCIERRCRARE